MTKSRDAICELPQQGGTNTKKPGQPATLVGSSTLQQPPALASHVSVTPMSCLGTSALPEAALAVLEWVLFDGLTHPAAAELFNKKKYGLVQDKPITRHAIGYYLRTYGKQWYAEQNVVRPWQLYSTEEKRDLITQGLGLEDFPCVHPRDRDNDAGATTNARRGSALDTASVRVNRSRLRVPRLEPTPHATTSRSRGIATEIPRAPALLTSEVMAPSNGLETHFRASNPPSGQEQAMSLRSGETLLEDPVHEGLPQESVGCSERSESSEIELSPEASAMMNDIKAEILRIESAWKMSCQAGDAAGADELEGALQELENEAAALSKNHYVQWRATTWSKNWWPEMWEMERHMG